MDCNKLELSKIAMEEYKVLHAELLQRNGLLVQVSGACAAAIVALIGLMASGNLPWLASTGLILLVLFVLILVWKIVDSDARSASQRIAEIKEYVNDNVGGSNEMPLSWERRFGILKRNYANRFRKT